MGVDGGRSDARDEDRAERRADAARAPTLRLIPGAVDSPVPAPLPPRARDAVVGREPELADGEAFLDRAGHGFAAMLLRGEAGIGKTVLWEACVEAAQARGHRVLVHRGVEAEAGLAFAALCDLAAPVLDEVESALAPPRRRALEVALLLADAAGSPPDPRAVGLAVLDVLRELARRAPVVVALDDVQWLDASSAGVLAVALRRLRDERVGVLATLRDAPGSNPPFSLEQCLRGAAGRRLGPLGLTELHRLLRDRLALELPRPQLARIEEVSGGNPFYALELAATVARIEPGDAIAVPDSLRALLASRLERLPAHTADVLLDAGARARPETALRAAARGEAGQALDALHVAARESVVVIDGARVRFAHPLLASLCYEPALPSRRRAAHRRLAGAVADPEERAWHLALAADGPDAELALEVDAAAAHAAARGATAAAAGLARLALGA